MVPPQNSFALAGACFLRPFGDLALGSCACSRVRVTNRGACSIATRRAVSGQTNQSLSHDTRTLVIPSLTPNHGVRGLGYEPLLRDSFFSVSFPTSGAAGARAEGTWLLTRSVVCSRQASQHVNAGQSESILPDEQNANLQ